MIYHNDLEQTTPDGRKHGKLHPRSRCRSRKEGIRCSCGSYGKKLRYIPEPYKHDPAFAQRVVKWRKKWGIVLMKRFRETYG